MSDVGKIPQAEALVIQTKALQGGWSYRNSNYSVIFACQVCPNLELERVPAEVHLT